jgi:hypothetical protein
MAPVGLGAAGQLQLLDQGRTGRPKDQVTTLTASPRRRPGQDLNPSRVDQDHAAQVQHDVMMPLQNQVAQVLHSCAAVSVSMSPRTVTMAGP